MQRAAPSGIPHRRSLTDALHALHEQRYPGRQDIITLFQPKSIDEMRRFIALHAPATRTWDEELVIKLWKEVRGTHPETFLTAVLGGPQKSHVDRNIRTATVRAYHARHEGTPRNAEHIEKEFLWEFRIRSDGSLTLRPFANSFSEKLYWTEVSEEQALKRAFREELGWTGRIDALGRHRPHIRQRYLTSPYLMKAADEFAYFKEGNRQAERFSHHESEKFPGLMTANELTHDIFNLNPCDHIPKFRQQDARLYQFWYHETKTPNLFVFGDEYIPPPLVHLSDLGLTMEALGLAV